MTGRVRMTARIEGAADVNRALSEMAPRAAIAVLRTTVHDIAAQLARDVKANVPRETGTLHGEIRARRRRGDRTHVESTIEVGRKAFYWRFLEYGDGPDGIEHAMFMQALQRMRPNIDRVYAEAFARKLEARMRREMRRSAGG